MFDYSSYTRDQIKRITHPRKRGWSLGIPAELRQHYWNNVADDDPSWDDFALFEDALTMCRQDVVVNNPVAGTTVLPVPPPSSSPSWRQTEDIHIRAIVNEMIAPLRAEIEELKRGR